MPLNITDFQAILDINRKINSLTDVKSILKDISHYASTILGAEGASILLINQQTGELHFEVAFGENAEVLYNLVIPKGKGIAGYVAEFQKPVIVNDTQNDERWYKDVDAKTKLQTKNLLAVPLVHNNISIGVIEVVNASRGYFDEDDIILITHFAEQAAIAISNAILYKEIQDKANELEYLYEISNLSNTIFDKRELFQKITQLISRAFYSDRVSLMFIDEESGMLKILSAIGIPDDVIPIVQNPINADKISSKVLNLGKYLFSNNIENSNLGKNKNLRYNKPAFISVPIKVKNIPIGVINISEPKDGIKYTNEMIKTLQTIANQVGVTYESIRSYEEKLENEKIKKEVDIMRMLQNALLISNFNDYKNISIFAKMKPAEIVGGDFYDIYSFSTSKIGFVIGDVSGKGLPASLFMAVSRSVIKSYAYQNMSPDLLLENSNYVLVDDSRVGMFVTVFYCVIDLEKNILEYSNAGHNLQYVYKINTGKFIPLKTKGIPLGISTEEKYEKDIIELESGDVVFAFTDGILEANNSEGEEFGIEKIKQIIKNYSSTNASTIVNAIFREVDNWAHGVDQWDDMTMVVIKLP